MLTFLMWFTLIKVFYLTPIMMALTVIINRTHFKLSDSEVPPFLFLSIVPIINFIVMSVIIASHLIDELEELRKKYVG